MMARPSQKRPSVQHYEDAWWASLEHEGWTDSTPFASWDDALYHALWLAWMLNLNRSAR